MYRNKDFVSQTSQMYINMPNEYILALFLQDDKQNTYITQTNEDIHVEFLIRAPMLLLPNRDATKVLLQD
jgi:hypothetical protein